MSCGIIFPGLFSEAYSFLTLPSPSKRGLDEQQQKQQQKQQQQLLLRLLQSNSTHIEATAVSAVVFASHATTFYLSCRRALGCESTNTYMLLW